MKTKPNIIVIYCDDLGYGDLGCYGSHVNFTPCIDKMADEGMRFTDFYSASSVCSPSRAALMTGCYPKRVGLAKGENFSVLLPGDPIGLSQNEVTIPKALKQAGYATKLIGKWHLGDQEPFLPCQHGFDSFFGLPYSNDMLPDHVSNDDFHFPHLPLIRDNDIVDIDPNQASLTDNYLKDAVRFIKQNRSKPFFLYLAHMYVHIPIYAPHKFLANTANGPYGAAVEHIDYCTGVILNTLKALDISKDTLIVFTSDNGSNCKGGGSNAPLRGGKGSVWEGGMRMPCIMHWPGTIPSRSVCSEVTSTMDLLPTFAAMAKVELPNDHIIDGHNIMDILQKRPDAKSPYEAFFYYNGNNLDAVRMGDWKLFLEGEAKLFNLKDDISESNNLYGDCSEVADQMIQAANRCRKDIGDDSTGIQGENCRPAGRVQQARYLTPLYWRHPYMPAEYD